MTHFSATVFQLVTEWVTRMLIFSVNLFLISFSEHEDDDEYSSNGQASPGHADDPECEASKGLSKKIENLEENNADNLSRHEAMISIHRELQIKVKLRDVF